MTKLLTTTKSPHQLGPSGLGGGSRAFSKAEIACLSIGDVHELTEDDLVRVIHSAQLPCLDRETMERLPLLDRETLERIVFLARRTCRNQGY